MIDLSELDCLFAMMETGPWVYNINGKVLPRTGNSYPSISPYDTLKAKDGFLSVGISTDCQWQKFCEALGMTDLAQNELYMTNESRGDHYMCGLKDELEAVTSKREKFEMEPPCGRPSCPARRCTPWRTPWPASTSRCARCWWRWRMPARAR